MAFMLKVLKQITKYASASFLAGTLFIVGFALFANSATAATIQCISSYDTMACSNGVCSYSYSNCTGPNPSCAQNGSVYCQDASGLNYCVTSESCAPGVITQICTPGETSSDGCGGGVCGGVKTCNAQGTGWSSCSYSSTNGNTCDSTQYGSYPSCNFPNTCSETAPSVSRTVTEYTCSSGSCAPNSYNQTQSCNRSVPPGQSCGTVTYGEWSECVNNSSNSCAQSGTHTRTVTSPVCTNGGCDNSVSTETGTCPLNTNGNSCTDNNNCSVNDACSNGSCVGTPAPVNGGWGAWSNWDCPNWDSIACVNNQQSRTCTRSRTCDNPSPSCSGAQCPGGNSAAFDSTTQTQSCGECIPNSTSSCGGSGVCEGSKTCRLDGTWGSCSFPGANVSCSDGNSCSVNDACNGSGFCSGTPTTLNGGWSGWSNWSACVSGQRTRTRTCTNPTPACGGASCQGSSVETENCGVCTSGQTRACGGSSGQCQGVETCNSSGQWSGSCNYSSSNNSACNDGNVCTNNDRCSNGTCAGTGTSNVGTWSSWSNWSSCLSGVQTRTRTCQGSNNVCGSPVCSGPSVETMDCQCTPGETSQQGCGSGVCAGIKTCQANSTWGACNSSGSNGAVCNDSNSCTSNDRCNNGICAGSGNSCNVVRCGNGVTEISNGEECDNGDAQNGSWPATCSSTCQNNQPPAVIVYDYDYYITPPIASIQPGQTQAFVLVFNRVGFLNQVTDIQISNCPTGAACALSRNNVQFLTNDPGETQSVVVTISNTNSIAVGSHTINFSARAFTGSNVSGLVSTTKQKSAQLLVGISPQPNDARCVSMTAPATVAVGQSFPVSITMRNAGTQGWWSQSMNPNNYFGLTLWPWPPGAFSGGVWNHVPGQVIPGQTVVFNFNITAPASPGSQTLSFRMLQQNIGWFGDVCSQPLVVVPATAMNCDESAVGINKMVGCVYNTKNLSGQRSVAPEGVPATPPIGNFTAINFNWGYNGPGTLTNNFSARWKGRFNLEPGSYIFHLSSDDGSRLFVNGNLAIEDWSDHGIRTRDSAVINLSGNTDLVYEYYENTSWSQARLWWEKITSPDQPVNVSASNSSAGCSNIAIIWTDASNNESGFRVYRGVSPDPALASLIATLGENSTDYVDTPPNNSPYSYFISSFVTSGGESSRVTANPAGIAALPCAPNISNSDKDIVGIVPAEGPPRDWSNTGNDCGGFNGAPSNLNISYAAEDVVKFEINICNTAGTADAEVEKIIDTLSNMEKPAGGWNARLQESSNPALWQNIVPVETGSFPSQILTFNFPAGYKVPQGLSRKLTFQAKLRLPSQDMEFSRFYNRASIYVKNLSPYLVSTPALLFYKDARYPTRHEIPPN